MGFGWRMILRDEERSERLAEAVLQVVRCAEIREQGPASARRVSPEERCEQIRVRQEPV